MTSSQDARDVFVKRTIGIAIRAVFMFRCISAIRLFGFAATCLVYVQFLIMMGLDTPYKEVFVCVALLSTSSLVLATEIWLHHRKVFVFTDYMLDACLLHKRTKTWSDACLLKNLDDAPFLLEVEAAWRRLPAWQQRRIVRSVVTFLET